MNTRLQPSHAFTVIALIAIPTIAAAWSFEIFGGYAPCPLCLQQRWPYYATIPIALVLPLLAKSSPTILRAGLLLLALIMLAGFALAVYHAGIEWKWWQGPQACAAGASLSGTLPDLSNARIIRCDEAPWRFIGLSFAGWNAAVSLLISFVALVGARGDRKSSQA
jgi:disulfide bond formation protein DsbB